MKKITCLIIMVLMPGLLILAQTPQSFKYQAIARDEAGNILSNWDIGIRISVIKGGKDGTVAYTEIHRVKSNLYGLINLSVGEGIPLNNPTGEPGAFSDIDWGSERFYIKMEMDTEGGEAYKEMGTTQLYAVPYALYADEAGKLREPSGHSNSGAEPAIIKTRSSSAPVSRDANPNIKLTSGGDSYLGANTGNVGIGTVSPGEKLHVTGNIFATGNINAGSNLVIFDENGNPRKAVLKGDGTLSFAFLCEGRIFDERNGQYYNIVKIGTQCWMSENLNIGTKVEPSAGQQNNGIIEKYCYNNGGDHCDLYGGLYTWNEMMDWITDGGEQGICPKSWHVPTHDEFKVLEGNVDTDYGVGDPVWNPNGWRGFDAGLKLKTTSGWYSAGNGSDDYGFSARPGGFYSQSGGVFQNLTKSSIFWTSDEVAGNAYIRNLYYQNNTIDAGTLDKNYALSLRCIKDFECGDSITDGRDGKIYGTVKIGDQCWMSQNLNVGVKIDAPTPQSNNSIIEKYCHTDLAANCDTFGGLYQWNEMMQYVTTEGVQGICPGGWHLPTRVEWETLTVYLGGNSIAGGKLKSTGTLEEGSGLWETPNTGATNSSGFNAHPGGCFAGAGGIFLLNLHKDAYFWTSTEGGITSKYKRQLYNDFILVNDNLEHKVSGLSVRCVWDGE